MPGRLMAGILRFGRWCGRSPTRARAGGSASWCWRTASWPGTSCHVTRSRITYRSQTLRWLIGSTRTSVAPVTGSRTSSSTSTGARRSSARPSKRCARSRTARPRPTARSRRSPGTRTRSGRSGRSAPRTASGSSCRATASWPRAESARTARLGPGTRSDCWSSKVSFSEDVRAELAAIAPARECDRLAELSALFHFAGRLHLLGRGEVSLHLDLASPALARRAFALLRSFEVSSEIRTYRRHAFGQETRYQLHVEGGPGALELLERAGVVDARHVPRERTPKRVISRSCCRGAFLRGALLAAGSVSVPPSPHLEVRSESRTGAEAVAAAATAEGAVLRVAERGDHALAYAKGIDRIAGVLAAAGANDAALALQERAVMGSARARANRLANADHANVVRAVAAAKTQLEAVRRLERGGRLDELSPPLREIAQLRLKHPSLFLRELAAKCDPPTSKSASHRRLRVLVRLSRR